LALWSERTNSWAGGAPQWPDASQTASAFYEYIDIQCYDDQDRPVPKWPLENNPDYRPTYSLLIRIQNQPVRGLNGKIPAAAAPGFQGTLRADSTSFDPNGSAASFGLGALVASAFIYLLS
jgi:hypothetical protein